LRPRDSGPSHMHYYRFRDLSYADCANIVSRIG